MDKSVPQVIAWHHSAEPRDAKTMTLGTDLSILTSHSCQILIISSSTFPFIFLPGFSSSAHQCRKSESRGFAESDTRGS